MDDFIEASRLDSGGIVVMPMPVEVAGMLLEVRGEFEPIARKNGIEFRADIPDGLPMAVLDKKQVERAIGNLLQNAFNYTPQGGEVKLAAKDLSCDGGKCILVTVSDTGPGISHEDRDKIFNKYYRSPKTAGTRGTGLGLAIVKAVAEAHGGRVEVESELGQGTTCMLYFPAATQGCGMTVDSTWAERALRHARHIATRIGPRGAATPEEQQAADYAQRQMQQLGLRVVRVETFNTPVAGWLSITTAVFRRSESFWPVARARMSMPVPAVYGTTMRSGRLG